MNAGWKTSTLDDTCEMYQPKTISGKEMVENGAYPVYGANGLIGRYNQFNHEEPQLLITCRGATCGSVNISAPRSWVTGNAMVVRPKNGSLDMRFLEYLFRGGIDISKAITGAAQPQITRTNLAPLEISYPISLTEQKRIVSILDEAFAGLVTATANAEKNLENAHALFESHLQSIFTHRGNGWVEQRLGSIAEFKNGLNFSRQSKGQTLRIVGVGDFHENSVVPTESLQSVTIDGELTDDYLIRRDDILTVRSNGSKDLVGRCMLVPEVDGMISYSGFIIRIRVDSRKVSSRFLLRFMKSSETRARLTRDGGGANISNINQAKLSELPISLPSFSEQEQIANRLDVLAAEAQRLETIYLQKLAALEELKKSLLHHAFTGQL